MVPDLKRQLTRYIALLDEKFYNLELADRQARTFREALKGRATRPAT